MRRKRWERMLFGVAIVALSACGGGGGGGFVPAQTSNNPTSTAPPTATAPVAPTTVADAIKVAEGNKSIPTLNRDATLAGPDVDGNGVRDDIDAYISGLTDSDAQKAALRQTSAALTATMLANTADPAALLEPRKAISNAAACLTARYGSSAGAKVRDMRKLTINTKTRFDAYVAFNAAMSGTTSLSPQGNGCAS